MSATHAEGGSLFVHRTALPPTFANDILHIGPGGLGTLLVAGLWLRLFPTLAQRGALVQGGTAGVPRRP